MQASHSRVPVALGERTYDVVIGSGILSQLPEMVSEALGTMPRMVFAVVDENVAPHWSVGASALRDRGVALDEIPITATEREKQLATIERITRAMAAARLERSDLVLAIGGGITGDVGGFAAASYRRGVPCVQCPTTLLSMVDASVGGKTGVNLEVDGTLQKNMVGAFHQPSLVVADIAVLGTLPGRELRAGLAECIKHGLLGGVVDDPDHLAWIAGSLDGVLNRDGTTLTELIARSVRCKAAIVAADERELSGPGASGPGRALLNLGHTFAHAIETLPGLSPTGDPADAPLLHGEAVSLGLVAAAAMGASLGSCPPSLTGEVRSLVRSAGLPDRVAALPSTDELLARMGADKKTAGGRVRVVAPEEGLRARLVEGPSRAALVAGWDAVRA